jgi:DNA-binding NarL/FixJ family response regulator
MRDALAALIATALDRSCCDPLAVSALAARLGDGGSASRPWDARALPAEAAEAWTSGDAARAIALLRQLDPSTLPAETAADVRLLTGEIALRAGDPGDAVSSLFEAADLFASLPRTPSAAEPVEDRPPPGESTAGESTAGKPAAEESSDGREFVPNGSERLLRPPPGGGRSGGRLRGGHIGGTGGAVTGAAWAGEQRWLESDALVRAGEAICFLGDHFRYKDVTSRAARLGLLPGGDRRCEVPDIGGGRRGRQRDVTTPSGGWSGDDGWDAVDGRRRDRTDERVGALAAQIEGFGALFDGRYRQAVSALRRVVTAAETGRLVTRRPDAAGSDARRPDATRSDARRLDETGLDMRGSEAVGLVRGSAAALACGDDGTALRLAARAEGLARAVREASVVPRALELKSSAEWWRGAHGAAESTALAGVRAAMEAGQPNAADNHLAMVALLAALRGDRAACRWRLAQLHDRRGRPGALGRWALAVLDLQAGRPHEAVARIGGIADVRSGRGHVLVQVMAAPDLVEAAVLAGEPQVAGAVLTAFDRWAASTGEPLRRALSARCHALLARRGSTEAEAGFREALRLHLAGESEFERARTQLLFGRDLRRRRRPGLAREQVGAALDAFARCGARPWAEQARAELRVCGGDTRATPAPLTAQQLQIARLVADGATNREVATRLFLSTRTVDHHMRNIFHRLGISSRTALAKLIT